jgi:hypothetical protein
MFARRAVAAFEGAPMFLLMVLISRAITLESTYFLVLRIQTTAELGALSSRQNELGFMSTIQKCGGTELYAGGETAGADLTRAADEHHLLGEVAFYGTL